jgi:hypothetical protein
MDLIRFRLFLGTRNCFLRKRPGFHEGGDLRRFDRFLEETRRRFGEDTFFFSLRFRFGEEVILLRERIKCDT